MGSPVAAAASERSTRPALTMRECDAQICSSVWLGQWQGKGKRDIHPETEPAEGLDRPRDSKPARSHRPSAPIKLQLQLHNAHCEG